jgi:hypothetical protein
MSLISNTGTLTITDNQPAWLASRPNLLQWYSVPGVTMNVLSGVGPGHLSYSGGAIDRTNSALYCAAGGGHGENSANDVLKLNLLNNTLAWEKARASGFGSGRPPTRHTWFDIIFSHARSKLMLMGGKAVTGTTGDVGSDNNVHAFNPATGDWDSVAGITYTSLPSNLNTNVCTGVVEDGSGNIWYANDNFMVAKFLANGTWQTLSSEPGTDSYSWGGAYDPLLNRVVMFRGSSSAYWNASTNARTGVSMSVPKDGTPIWCNDLNDFLYLPWSGMTVYRVNNDTYSASVLSLSGTAPPAPSADGYGNICGRFFYCPTLKIVGYVRDISTNFYFFRTG